MRLPLDAAGGKSGKYPGKVVELEIKIFTCMNLAANTTMAYPIG